MKILHVIEPNDPAGEGPSLIALRLATAQATLGHEVHLLSFSRSDVTSPNVIGDVHVHRMHLPRGIAGLGAVRMRSSVSDLVKQVQILHLHGFVGRISTLAAATADKFGRPYFVEFGAATALTPRQKRVMNAAAALRLINVHAEVQLVASGLMAPRLILPNGDLTGYVDACETWISSAQRLMAAYLLAIGFPVQSAPDNPNRLLRVLHVTSSIDATSGGPVTALAGLTQAQVMAGIRTSVVSNYRINDHRTVVDRMYDASVNVRLTGPVRGSIGWSQGSGRLIRNMIKQADVVHIHAIWEDLLYKAARAAWKQGVPYIIRPCGMLEPWSLGQKAFKKKLYMRLRLRWMLNHAAAINFTGALEQASAIPLQIQSSSIVEPIGLDLHDFAQLPARGTFRALYPELGNRLLVLFLSRLHPKKGLEFLIPAFCKAAVSDAMLVIAGPDSDGYRAQVEKMAVEHGVRDRTIFTGMLHGTQRVAALVDADLFVLPSHQENFGIVVIEALAAGLPVLISKNVNIYPEIVATGFGSAVALDVDEIAGEMRRWLGDNELRKVVRERGPAFVREHYDWKHIALRWAHHYRSIIGSRRQA